MSVTLPFRIRGFFRFGGFVELGQNHARVTALAVCFDPLLSYLLGWDDEGHIAPSWSDVLA